LEKWDRKKRVFIFPSVDSDELHDIISLANVGYLFYDQKFINNRFCASNKMWEYLNAGTPVVSNNIFSLNEKAVMGYFKIENFKYDFKCVVEKAEKEKVNNTEKRYWERIEAQYLENLKTLF
ncbi:hypothetical protein OA385_05065, partial [Paracoccaceae bacterium]|nr:hypothetical protein [Paracoccaceae bacterium]